MSICGTGLWGPLEPINPDLNASILTATAMFGGVAVRWTLNGSSLPGISHTRLYRGVSNDYSLAVSLQNVKGDTYFDPVTSITADITYYYWIRNVAVDGQVGNLIGPASATVVRPIGEILDALSGGLDETHLSMSLRADIDNIDLLSESLTLETLNRTEAYGLITAAFGELSSDFSGVQTLVLDEINARQTADGAIGSSIEFLAGRVDDNEITIIDEGGFTLTGNAAFAYQINSINTSLGDRATTAALATESQARSDGDGALAQQITTLDAGIGQRITTAIQESDLVASNGYCLIGDNPSTTVITENDCIDAGGTWNSTGQLAASTKSYQTANDENVGILQIASGTHTNTLGNLVAQYMVKTSVTSQDGKQLVGGFGLYNDGATVDAAFEVDRFWIGSSSAGATKPFMVSDGAVYMDTAYIKELAADKIATGSLTANVGIGTNGLIWAQSGTYQVRMGNHSVGGDLAMFSFTNGTNPIVKFMVDGTAEFTGKVVISAGSTGIGSFSDAGALATKNGITWEELLSKPTTLEAIDAHAALQLDKKSAFFFQAGFPVSPDTGDFWVDTADGNKVYHFDGFNWVYAGDDRILQAIVDSQNAQTTADGKAVVFFDATAPYGQEGDLWKKPGGAFYRHDGSADGDISTLVYDSVLLGVSSYEQIPTSVYVSPDGHHLFMCGNVSDKVHQFSLSIANSLTGASYVGFFSVAAEDILPQGMTFAPDGTKMFMCGQSTDKLYQYNLTTPWTITSGVTIAGSVTVAAASNGVSVIDSRVYISTFSAIHQYTCVAGDYDITSGVTSVGSFSTASHGNNHDVVVLPVGDTMYTADPTNDVIHQWALTDFDVTSAVHVSSFSVAAQSTFITGLCFSGDRGKLFIADYNAASTDAIYQYSLASPWVQVATENNHYSQAVAPTGIKGDTWYNTDSREFYNHDGTTWVVSATVGATWGTDVTGQPEDSNILNSLQSWFQIADKPTTLAAFDEDAATTLDDKTIAYFQASQPTGTQNDLWFDTDDGNKLYRHNGTSWQVAQDSKIGQALFNAQTAQDTADGKAVIYYATSAPGAATSGDLWKDTDGTKHLYRKNAGGGWDVVSTENKIFHQEATPTGSLGDMWFKPSTNEFKQHNGSTWAYVSDVTGAKTALNTANVGSSTAATVESGANKANAGLNSAGEIQKVIKGTNIPTPTSGLAVGLNLTGNYLGYNSTGTSSGWKTYMTNTGNFYLAGAGTNSLSWNGTSLDIVGTITGSTINGGTINGTSIHGGNIYSGNFYTSSGSGGNPKIAIKSSNTTFVITDSSGVARVSMGSIGTLIDANGNNTPAIQGRCTSSNGILGISNSGDAIRGESASGHGVFGDTNGSSKAGVYGVGYGAARGVWGSSSYVGVWGETYANVVGVAGFANAASGGSGVQGEGTTQGGFFYSNKANGKGVVAHGNSTNGMGIDAYGALYGGYFSTGGSIAIQCNGAIRLGSGTVHSFTGTHDCLVIDGDTLPVQGDIVEVVTVVNRASVDDIIPQVILAATAQSKKAYGVCSRIGTFPAWHAPTASNIVSQPSEEGADPILESTSSATSQNIDIGGLSNMSQTEYEAIVANYTLVSANGVGEGQINVCSANGDFEVGDFICTSTVAGKGQRYDGNDMRVVVAKCLEPVVWANETETTKMVACVYMCS